jgi:hypothetical protein
MNYIMLLRASFFLGLSLTLVPNNNNTMHNVLAIAGIQKVPGFPVVFKAITTVIMLTMYPKHLPHQ